MNREALNHGAVHCYFGFSKQKLKAAASSLVPLISSPFCISCAEQWRKRRQHCLLSPTSVRGSHGQHKRISSLTPLWKLVSEISPVRLGTARLVPDSFSLCWGCLQPQGLLRFFFTSICIKSLATKVPPHTHTFFFSPLILAWADILIKNYQYIAGNWKLFLSSSFSAQILLCGCGHMFDWLGSQADVHSTVFILFRWLWHAGRMHWCWQWMWGEPDSWQHLHFSELM